MSRTEAELRARLRTPLRCVLRLSPYAQHLSAHRAPIPRSHPWRTVHDPATSSPLRARRNRALPPSRNGSTPRHSYAGTHTVPAATTLSAHHLTRFDHAAFPRVQPHRDSSTRKRVTSYHANHVKPKHLEKEMDFFEVARKGKSAYLFANRIFSVATAADSPENSNIRHEFTKTRHCHAPIGARLGVAFVNGRVAVPRAGVHQDATPFCL